jgi:hypothetical protein
MRLLEPSAETLARYGLTLEAWHAIACRQGGVCGACKRLPASGRLCIDHEHATGWRLMPDEERAKYVRGLLCYRCNRFYLAQGMTRETALGAAAYLEAYEARGEHDA